MNLKNKTLLFLLVFLFVSSIKSQDTMRITIPDIFISQEDEGETIAIPVLIEYDSLIQGIQIGLTWDPEQFSFDTIIFGQPALEEYGFYGVTSESQVRVFLVTQPGPYTFDFRESPLAFTIYFKAKKFTGLARIEFDSSFQLSAHDGDFDPIPTTITTGTITYNDQVVRTQFDLPVPGPEEGQICTGLFSRGTASLLGFDFALEWQTDEFLFDSVILGDNPLGLVPEEVFAAPGQLSFRRDTFARDTTPLLPFGTKLFDLCFTPLSLRANSNLFIGRDSTPSFQVLREDTTVVNAPYELFAGALYLPDEALGDTVRLSIVISSDPAPSDTVTCATILVDNYIDVSAFDFLLRWPTRLRLNSVGYPETSLGLDESNLRNASAIFARFAYVPDSLVNLTLPPGTPLLELCFIGEISPCDFVQIELAQQPASTYFDRKIFDFTEGAPLPYALNSGYLNPSVQDTLELELEFAISDPDNLEHEVRLSTPTGRCFSAYSFHLSYDPQDLNYFGEDLAEARLDSEYTLERYRSPGGGVIPLELKDEIPGTPTFFPAGEIATFRLRRRSSSDQDTVPILLTPDGPSFAKLFTPDGDSLFIPVILRSGGLIFRQDTMTATRQISSTNLVPLTVYPNPTNGEINLDGLPKTIPVAVWLYDQLGRIRWHNTGLPHSFTPPTLPSGAYWLRTQQGEKTWVNALQIE